MLNGVLPINRKDQGLWWMQLEYKWLICLFKHSNILRIFNEIKNKIAPSVCVCYFCLHHQKLFIHITQKIQTNKYNHEKRSKYLEVGKVAKPVLLYSNRLEGYLESDGDETGSRRISCLRRLRQGGRLAAVSSTYFLIVCKLCGRVGKKYLDYHMENFHLP